MYGIGAGVAERRVVVERRRAGRVERIDRDPRERLVQRLALLVRRHQPRCPPGTQSTSPPGGFAARASRKSRSERRLRYCSASLPTASSAASATVSRSARRQTVRARCSGGGAGRAAREHERRQRRQRSLTSSQRCLEPRDLLGRDAQPRALARRLAVLALLLGHAEVGAEVEEVVLDAPEPGVELARQRMRAREAEHGAELVDGAVGADAQRGLRDAPAIAEARLAGVAAAGVDAVEPHDRFAHGSSVREAHRALTRPARGRPPAARARPAGAGRPRRRRSRARRRAGATR